MNTIISNDVLKKKEKKGISPTLRAAMSAESVFTLRTSKENKNETCNPFQNRESGEKEGSQTPGIEMGAEGVFTPRSSKVIRSPTLIRPPLSTGNTQGKTVENTSGSQSQTTTPSSKVLTKEDEKKWVTNLLAEKRGNTSRVEFAVRLTRDLKMFMYGKTNMHMDAKRIVEKVLKEVEGIRFEVEDLQKALAEKDKEIQMLRTGMESNTGKRGRPSPEVVSETPASPKRSKTKAKERIDKETPNTEKWKEVVNKRKKVARKKPTEPRVRLEPKAIKKKSDALLIGAKAEGSYAEILRKIKKDPNLSDIGGMVNRVRKTRNGDMLLEFKGDAPSKVNELETRIKEVIGKEAEVRALSQQVTMECRNMDEVTEDEELRAALMKSFAIGNAGEIGQIKLRKTHGSTQMGTFKVSVAVANKMIEVGKVKVGWSVCRLRRSQQLLRCYKCLGFDHVAKHCRSEFDHSKTCWRCGLEGHKAMYCTNSAKCTLCKESEGNAHPTGSLLCKAYKEAVSKRRWK
jgi:hypothetical protein